MNSERARAKVALDGEGFLMRVCNTWRSLKGRYRTERSQIDLCHFIRVVLIFAPTRMFFQYNLPLIGLPPFLTLLAGLLLTAITWSAFTFTHWFLFGLLVMGLALGIFALVLAIGKAVFYIYDTERFEDRLLSFCYWGFIWLWWPLWKLGLGFRWLGIKVFEGLSHNLWYSERLTSYVTGFGILFGLAVTAFVGLMLWFYYTAWAADWLTTGVVTALVIGGILLSGATVFGIVKANEAAKRHPAGDLPPRKQRDWETSKALWAYVVAKKHRVCPLIEVK